MKPTLVKGFLACCFAGAVLGALGWWYLMPEGFPASHSRFWVNSVLPPVAAVVFTIGLAAVVRGQNALLKCLVLALGTVPIAAAMTGKYLFPESMSGKLLFFSASCSLFGVSLAIVSFRNIKSRSLSVPLKILCISLGVGVGTFIPWSQRGADPATKPCGRPTVFSESDSAPSKEPLRLADGVLACPDSGNITIHRQGTRLELSSLLTFESRSPDRFWTLFAPSAQRRGLVRSLVNLKRSAESVVFDYRDDGRSRLRVHAPDSQGRLLLEAISELPQPVYSHLNTFAELRLRGDGELALSFSPCPQPIALRPFDYPFGRPIRLAYLDARNAFRVVEAQSGEKGPFKTLAEGVLKDDEPLRMTIFVAGKPQFHVTLRDWAKQASRQLSPTAGWGLPENSIEFCLDGDDVGEGMVFITLAATSVGRGYDSVGHVAGTYRNRMIVEPAEESD
ncbi:MAG: hypothetical protein JXB10_03070 [Pirellulales bacterium]|nr:hypothetical protein [Pirellulales bacterium]